MWKGDFPYKWDLERHPRNPVLRAVPGTWEATWFVVDDVILMDSKFYMYYSGSDESSNRNSQLGLAFSEDGITWTRLPHDQEAFDRAEGAGMLTLGSTDDGFVVGGWVGVTGDLGTGSVAAVWRAEPPAEGG